MLLSVLQLSLHVHLIAEPHMVSDEYSPRLATLIVFDRVLIFCVKLDRVLIFCVKLNGLHGVS